MKVSPAAGGSLPSRATPTGCAACGLCSCAVVMGGGKEGMEGQMGGATLSVQYLFSHYCHFNNYLLLYSEPFLKDPVKFHMQTHPAHLPVERL